jgi:secreted trypsin-like serine protease
LPRQPRRSHFGQERAQLGVVNWGDECAREFPGLYSRVSGTKNWIDATICELSSSHPASCEGRLMSTMEMTDSPGKR